MKKILRSEVVVIGLAIFSMLFGAGNLMFPLNVGLMSGEYIVSGTIGFLVTAILLPLIGLLAIILFDGDYDRFFGRLGRRFGAFFVCVCMLVIGPVIGIPRIVDLSYTLIGPFIPQVTLFSFSIVFLLIAFLGTVRERKIIDLLGYIIGPALLVSLGFIVVQGLFLPGCFSHASRDAMAGFLKNLKYGFSTLDLMATIFFGSIVLTIMKRNVKHASRVQLSHFALAGLKGGVIGCVLLAIIYIALSFIGYKHGCGFGMVNEGILFREIALHIVGVNGGIVVAMAVLMACFSTAIALLAVVAEYVHKTFFKSNGGYVLALLCVVAVSLVPCNLGLDVILRFTSGPIANVLYPVVIVLTLCNLAYKIIGFKSVRGPVWATLIVTSLVYGFRVITLFLI
jgi:branched-chain amino acid:cation transporter, LIVCS family